MMRFSKRYTKSENWFSQMQSKLVGEIVRNILKKSKSTDACDVELRRSKFVIVKFLVLRKWAVKLLLLKISLKINYFSYCERIEMKFGYEIVGICSNILWFFQNFSFSTSPVIEVERYRNENNELIIMKSISWTVMKRLCWNLDII